MPERTLPGLGLTGFWDLGQNGWNTGMDINLRLLSVVANMAIDSREDAAPGAPTDGDVVIANTDWGATVTSQSIQVRDDGAWIELLPIEGWRMYDKATDELLTYNGTIWEVQATAVTGGTAEGLATLIEVDKFVISADDTRSGKSAFPPPTTLFDTRVAGYADSGLTVAAGVFTVPARWDGKMVRMNYTVSSQSDGSDYAHMSIAKNGTDIFRHEIYWDRSSGDGVMVTPWFPVATGDTLEARLRVEDDDARVYVDNGGIKTELQFEAMGTVAAQDTGQPLTQDAPKVMRAVSDGTQVGLSNTVYRLIFQNVEANADGGYDPATGLFTVPASWDGETINFAGGIRHPQSGCTIYLRYNGTIISQAQSQSSRQNVQSGPITVATGDTFDIAIFVTGTASIEAVHSWIAAWVIEGRVRGNERAPTGQDKFVGAMQVATTQDYQVAATFTEVEVWENPPVRDTHGFVQTPGRFTVPAGVSKVRLRYFARTANGAVDTQYRIAKNGAAMPFRDGWAIGEVPENSYNNGGSNHETSIIDVVPGDEFSLEYYVANTNFDHDCWFEIEAIEHDFGVSVAQFPNGWEVKEEITTTGGSEIVIDAANEDELIIVARALSTSSSGYADLQLSADGGVTPIGAGYHVIGVSGATEFSTDAGAAFVMGDASITGKHFWTMRLNGLMLPTPTVAEGHVASAPSGAVTRCGFLNDSNVHNAVVLTATAGTFDEVDIIVLKRKYNSLAAGKVVRKTITADYTMTGADFAGNVMLEVDSASDINITVPAVGGTEPCMVKQKGAGAPTFVASGTTLNSFNGDLKMGGQYAWATVDPEGGGVFNVSGNLTT